MLKQNSNMCRTRFYSVINFYAKIMKKSKSNHYKQLFKMKIVEKLCIELVKDLESYIILSYASLSHLSNFGCQN